MIHISLTDRQAEFLERLVAQMERDTIDRQYSQMCTSIRMKIKKEWDAQADHHE